MLTICKELPRLNYQFQRLYPQSIIAIDEAIYSNNAYIDDAPEITLLHEIYNGEDLVA